MADADANGATPEIAEIFAPAQIAPAYQPVVDLSAGDVIGAEALARWPRLAVTPAQAFAYARAVRRHADLDGLLQEAAVRTASGLVVPSFDLFVNVAPDSPVDRLVSVRGDVQVVADLSARALDRNPDAVLADVARLRAGGVGISLGHLDAGDPAMAFLPFLAPDVVRVNLGALMRRSAREAGTLLDAVATYAARTGAVVLAEGIETEAQATAAVRFGAVLGQGWWFGKPGPLPSSAAAPPAAVSGGRLLLGGGDHLERQRRAVAAGGVHLDEGGRAGMTLTERLIGALQNSAA